tara:strand:+ start:202 stop:963 length:762 start_codon:yes stop_codon:yes gene_type:complete
MRKKLNRKQIRYLLLKEAKKEMLFEARKRKKYVEVIDHVLLENKNLINSKYLHTKEINEGILDSLMGFGGDVLGNLMPGFIGQFKQKIVVELLASLGMSTTSPFAIALINIFEEIQYTKLLGYFKDWGGSGCENLIDDVLRGLSDSLQEGIASYFGLNVQAQGMVGGTFRESITTTVNSEFLPQLKDPIKEFICNLPVGDMLSQIKDVVTGKKSVGDVTSQVLGKAGDKLSKAGSALSPTKQKATSAGDKLFR